MNRLFNPRDVAIALLCASVQMLARRDTRWPFVRLVASAAPRVLGRLLLDLIRLACFLAGLALFAAVIWAAHG